MGENETSFYKKRTQDVTTGHHLGIPYMMNTLEESSSREIQITQHAE